MIRLAVWQFVLIGWGFGLFGWICAMAYTFFAKWTRGPSKSEPLNAHGLPGHQGCHDRGDPGPCDCLCHRDDFDIHPKGNAYEQARDPEVGELKPSPARWDMEGTGNKLLDSIEAAKNAKSATASTDDWIDFGPISRERFGMLPIHERKDPGRERA